MPTLTESQVRKLVTDAGFTGTAADTAVAVARAESGWRTDALGDVNLQGDYWGPSVGLFQIRCVKSQTGTGKERDCAALRDPAFAARSAYAISKRGTDWNPWTVFTSGAYRQYLSKGAAIVTQSASGFLSPLLGSFRVTTQFGSANAYDGRRHDAVDWGAPAGTLVYASGSGTVKRSDATDKLGGNIVEIVTDDGYTLGYAHLQDRLVKVGDKVSAGMVIGTVGSTGEAVTGSHLHFSVKAPSGSYVDPLKFLDPLAEATAYLQVPKLSNGSCPTGFLSAKEYAAKYASQMPFGLEGLAGGLLRGFGSAIPDDAFCWNADYAAEASYAAAEKAGTDPLSVLGPIGDFFALLNPVNLVRLLALIVGGGLVIIGGMMVVRST